MSKKNIIRFCLLLLGVAIFILFVSCSSEPAEEEVVREVEVIKEVEVTAEVELAEEEVSETIEELEEEADAMEESADDELQATGSEEEGGSPTLPTQGKVGANQAVEDRISWIQQTDLVSDPADVRIIANKMDDVIIYMETLVDGTPTELIVTNQIKQIRQLNVEPDGETNGEFNSLFLIMTAEEWDAIAADVERLISGGDY